LATLKKALDNFNNPANPVSQLLPGVWLIEQATLLVSQEK
jgi:hypothetical protein